MGKPKFLRVLAFDGDEHRRHDMCVDKVRLVAMSSTEKTILIVEDEAEARQALSEYLEAKGYEVTCATDGLDGLNQVKKNHPKLVLLDLSMPILDGYAFLELAREDHLLEDTAVVVTTAYQTRRAPGASAVVQKPIRPEKLMPLIHRFVDDHPSHCAPSRH